MEAFVQRKYSFINKTDHKTEQCWCYWGGRGSRQREARAQLARLVLPPGSLRSAFKDAGGGVVQRRDVRDSACYCCSGGAGCEPRAVLASERWEWPSAGFCQQLEGTEEALVSRRNAACGHPELSHETFTELLTYRTPRE